MSLITMMTKHSGRNTFLSLAASMFISLAKSCQSIQHSMMLPLHKTKVAVGLACYVI